MSEISEGDREWAQKVHSLYPEVHSYGFDNPSGRHRYVNLWSTSLTDEESEDVIKAREFLKEFSFLKRSYKGVSPTSGCLSIIYCDLYSHSISEGCFILAARGLGIPIYRYSYTHRAVIGISSKDFDSLVSLNLQLKTMFDF